MKQERKNRSTRELAYHGRANGDKKKKEETKQAERKINIIIKISGGDLIPAPKTEK